MDSASSFTLADSPIRHKRARVSRACDQCRRKKIRCDADKSTPCTNCRTYGFGCSFLDSAKKRGPPKGYIEALENRLKRMEGLLGGLVDGVDKGTRPKKASNREVDVERRRRKKENENENEEEGGDDDDDDEEEEDDAEDNDEDDGDDGDDSASSSHSSRGRVNEYRRQRRRNDALPATKAPPLTGVDFGSKFQHLNALSSPPQTPEEFVEDLSENLEKLDMDEYANTRYVGNSSGLHLLTPQFENKDGIFKLPQMGGSTPSDPAQYVQVKKEPDCGDAVEPDDLEPELGDLKKRLIDIYFAKIHVIYPIINKRHFYKQLHGSPLTRPSPALTYAMFAMAARYLPEDEPEGNPETLGQEYFDSAMESLDQVYMLPRVSTVQALLLLALFQNGVAEAKRHWLDCGLAIRMAQELGLHRSSSKWKIPKSEIEARKRLWWTCFVMDRWFGAAFGRPLVISEDDCDVDYPSIYEEEDDEISSPVSQSRGSFSPEPLLRNSPPVKKPAYRAFLEIIKISETLGRVLQTLYTPKARKRRTTNEKTLKGLGDELATWWASLPQELQWQKDDSHNVVSSPIIGSINLCYYTVLILIHRPYIPSSKSPNSRPLTSLSTCTIAAANITKIIQCMNANKYFESTWPFSVYNIFQSSLIHMYNNMRSNQDIARTASSSLATNIQILDAIQFTSFQARKLSLLLGALSKKEVNFDESNDGGFWVTVNSASKSPAPPLSPTLTSKTPSTRSSYQSYTPPSTSIASPIIDPCQHNRYSTSSANSAMTSSADVSIPLPVPPHVLSHTSLPMSSSSSNLVTLQPEPAFSLRPFAFASQPDFQRPVTQPPPDDNMTFALDSNGGNGEMPNEYFRVDSNPFYSMSSTYNVEDWDVWMVEHGSAGTMNVG